MSIYGPESQVQIAAAMLLVRDRAYFPVTRKLTLLQDHVPFEADMAVPPNPDLPRVVSTPEFNAFVESVKRELQVAISPNFKHNPAGAYTNGNVTAAR